MDEPPAELVNLWRDWGALFEILQVDPTVFGNYVAYQRSDPGARAIVGTNAQLRAEMKRRVTPG